MKSELIKPLEEEREKFSKENRELNEEVDKITDKIADIEQEAEEAKAKILEKTEELKSDKELKKETIRCNNELINSISSLLRTYEKIKETDD